MKIAIIAANGRSGTAFLNAAIQAEHEVNAGYMGSNNFPNSPKITAIKCDATNPEDLAKLISGCDAVVSLIGHVKGSPVDVQTNAMQSLLQVMNEVKLGRLISLTGTGVRFPGDKITLMDRFLNLGVNIVDPARIKDGKAAAELLKSSQTDWTLIRVLKLQNVAPKPYKLSANGPTKTYVGREEVAQAILEVLEQRSFIRQAPIISKA